MADVKTSDDLTAAASQEGPAGAKDCITGNMTPALGLFPMLVFAVVVLVIAAAFLTDICLHISMMIHGGAR
jgi:hypothetical protein